MTEPCWVLPALLLLSKGHGAHTFFFCRPLFPTSHGCQSPPGWHCHGTHCSVCSLQVKGARSDLGGRGHQQRRQTTVTEAMLCPPCSSFDESVGWFPNLINHLLLRRQGSDPPGVKKPASIFHSQSTIFCNTLLFSQLRQQMASLSKNLSQIILHTQNTYTILTI